jgi:hypothetical protein
MTPTQIARRSDALYADGTRGMTRRVLCDMVAQRESDLEDARAENSKLRKLLIDVSEEVPWSFMDTTKYYMPLRADKLRKLLCRMRELGVEVEGWVR